MSETCCTVFKNYNFLMDNRQDERFKSALNFGVVCMVVKDHPSYNETVGNNGTEPINSSRILQDINPCSESTGPTDFGYEGEFHWDRQLVGNILGSFFWGYLPIQLLAGWLSTKFGGKHVMSVGMLIGSIAGILTPISARTHPILLMVVRAIMGLSMGVAFPAVNALIGRWAPPNDRSILMAVALAGATTGNIGAGVFTGLLCPISWTLPHYIFGVLGILWCIYWHLISSNGPESHPRISNTERTYILKSLRITDKKKSVNVQWSKILTCPAVWAACAAHFSILWGIYTIILVVPLYMQDVLRFNIKQNGVLSSLPNLVGTLTGPLVGMFTDRFALKTSLSRGTVRKIMQTICNSGLIFMVALGFLDCENRALGVVFLCFASGIFTFMRGGVGPNIPDIAPRQAGMVFGIANTFANFNGLLITISTGALTTNGTQEEWRKVFYICGAVLMAGLIVFIIFASGEEQEWAKEPTTLEIDVDEEVVFEVKKSNYKPLMISGDQSTLKFKHDSKAEKEADHGIIYESFTNLHTLER